MDYVTFAFNDKGVIPALNWPTINLDGEDVTSTNLGYRDKLCALIGKNVISAEVYEQDKIEIIFENKAVLRISIRPEDHQFPEAATFDRKPDVWWVW